MSIQTATFAGGCFWCMVMPFDAYDGVLEVISGYCGGHVANPSYQDVKQGTTGHLEAVQVHFDSATISYAELVDIYWTQINPTDDGGQFGDRGDSYRTAIFVHDGEQLRVAQESKEQLARSGTYAKPIVTRILPLSTFYPAEEYHQDYARRNPEQYAADSAVQERKHYLHGMHETNPDTPPE